MTVDFKKKTNPNNDTLNKIEKEIEILNKKKFFVLYESIWKLIFFHLVKGLALGLGWVIGATILVSLLTFMLSKFEFIPIIGELISKIIMEIQSFER